MPGKPAARIGDQTAHGGVIVGPGVPMVLIEKKPASVMGDMHTCPQVTPGTPPIPHVGGTVMGTGVMVLIGGKPAARMGDTAICTGPPDSIVAGCPTVLIGDGGGGGGGAGSGGQAKRAKSKAAAGEIPETHTLDVSFKDKAGNPITGLAYSLKGPDGRTTTGTLTGRIKKAGIEKGSYDIELHAIISAAWSPEEASVGETVKMTAETSGIESGEEATFEIFIRDANFADRSLTTVTSKVDGDKAEAEWKLEVDKRLLEIQDGREEQGGYSNPQYYFVVNAGGMSLRSGFLKYKDFIELRLKDSEGNAIGNQGYQVYLPNGEVREGTLDGDGYAKVEDIPPGRVRVSFDIEEEEEE